MLIIDRGFVAVIEKAAPNFALFFNRRHQRWTVELSGYCCRSARVAFLRLI